MLLKVKTAIRGLQLRIGSWPAGRVTWGLVGLFSVWLLADALFLGVGSGIAQSSYDAMVRMRLYAAAPDPRIVIVDIDEASLLRMGTQFGRWPWPRDTLAAVLDHIGKQQPAAVVWDVVFSDADRLSPGGDAAFDAAVRRSNKNHFSVVRLPSANDGLSRITRQVLPGLWLPSAVQKVSSGGPSTVALIPPVLPAVASGRLGYNNGYVDGDGVLRRFRYAEVLADGSVIQSLPLSIHRDINAALPAAQGSFPVRGLRPADELVAWRKKAGVYPTVPFADVFALADGGAPLSRVPGFAGKVVIIGSTAPSLHDVHPTPLSPTQAGVDSLATVIDNILHERHIAELPRWFQVLLAAALCVGIALWVRVHGVASLAPAILVLPASLLCVSYLSLHGLPLFIDLHLTAGIGLAFLAALRLWNGWRRDHWSSPADPGSGQHVIWCWRSEAPWVDAALDRTMDALEQHAPNCRIVTPDISVSWPSSLHWPELAGYLAICGPRAELEQAQHALAGEISGIAALRGLNHGSLQALPVGVSRGAVCAAAMAGWADLVPLPQTQPHTNVASQSVIQGVTQ
ncbi:MAG: CHASE2 domain-containing protein [Polaromonas sp.]|uniref:CHASE2 domain-containing protein n=1 Tax=Polaromonas sp. TaxID=1869339 RepID=UPI0025CE3BEB|nr:CHASE2 domain-containing protein [Polaromonas sp.]MBI2725471.1 CHASE2 domain-containing protein [Polaromonas sp.]